MNTHLLILLSFFFSIPSSIFAHPFNFPNLPNNLPNITFPTSWDSFNNFSGCHIGDKVDGLAQIKKYFHQFGYLPANSVDNYTDDFDDSLESALKTYQLNFNLNDTGVLDDTTLQQITLPRCGNADVVNGSSTMKSGSKTTHSDSSSIHSVAHYSFFPSQPRWPSWKRDLTYAFAPENQLKDTVKAVFARAFVRWQDVTPLTFRETQYYDRADITIGFFGGVHGDGEPFDGILGTLAHAFSPPDGRFHLDNAENWVVDVSTASSTAAIDLESVAVHEIGHILGLGHSSVPDAIMYPTLSTGLKKVDLASDDVEGIQVLYGGNPNGSGSGSGSTGSTSSQERDSSDGGVQYIGSFKWALSLVMGSILLVL